MSNNLDEVSDGLEELIEEHLSRITDKLRQAHSIKDVSDEVGTLNDLLNSYKRRTQMFDSLVDVRTPEAKKAQVRDKLEAQDARVIANREACKRTAERSHEILRRSARLLSRVQPRVDRETNRGSSYQLELCGYCERVRGISETNVLGAVARVA